MAPRRKTSKKKTAASNEIDELFLEVAGETITVRDGGETRSISRAEAVVRKQFETAVTGSPHAQRQFIERLDRAREKLAAAIMEECELWSRYKSRWRAEIEKAHASGQPEPTPLPHPDDIEIDLRNGVRFHGPCSEKELREIESQRRFIGALLYQDEMERFLDKRRHDTRIEPGSPLFTAMIVDRGLPKRLRLGEDGLFEIADRLKRLTGPELLKRTRKAWRKCGVTVGRGQRVIPPDIQLAMIKTMAGALKDWANTGEDPDALKEIADERSEAFVMAVMRARQGKG